MKSYSPKEVIRILKKNGWEEKRVRGSHFQFTYLNTGKMVTIPVSKNNIPIGTLKSIEKQTGIIFK